MKIIPAINCQEFDCVKTRFIQSENVLFGAVSEQRSAGTSEEWLHLDIADGGFTNGYTTWRNSEDLKKIVHRPNLKIEVHLMVNEPESILADWTSAGVSRVIIHLEATTSLRTLIKMCSESQVELMLALKPETPALHAFPYLLDVSACQLLAVTPGLSGQAFQNQTLEKIQAIRGRFPHMLIEVDGGINPQTALACKALGADQLVVASYLFDSDNPTVAYQELQSIN